MKELRGSVDDKRPTRACDDYAAVSVASRTPIVDSFGDSLFARAVALNMGYLAVLDITNPGNPRLKATFGNNLLFC